MNKGYYFRFALWAVLIVVPALAATAQATDSGAPNGDPALSDVSVSQLQQYVPGITPAEARRLINGGEIMTDYSGGIDTRIAPTFSGRDAMVKDLQQTEANVGIELLFARQLPNGFRDRKDFWLTLYNIMRSVSTLKGIEYYSADRHRMRIFYYDAYAIASPDQRNTPLPDPVVSTLPTESHIYTYHKDSSFGNYVMDVGYDVGPTTDEPEYIRMSLTNVTTMFYTVVPVAQPRHLQLDLVVVPEGNTLLFYSNFIANAPNIFGLRDQIDISFSNRIKALFKWFTGEIGKVAGEE